MMKIKKNCEQYKKKSLILGNLNIVVCDKKRGQPCTAFLVPSKI